MAITIAKWQETVQSKARLYHECTPGLRNLPLPVIAIISAIAFVNSLVWVAAGVVLV